ncbi:MAG: DUF4105 domain-containing protein [Burkholderiales bacterium]|nr:DUF4105 domain-containing protein [Burkholderiales bacterium]
MRSRLTHAALRMVALLALAWAAAAFWLDRPGSRWTTGVLTVSILLVGCGALIVMRRPWQGFVIAFSVFAVVLIWWLMLPPRADRDWLEEVSRTPRVTFDGTRFTVHDLRDFRYGATVGDYAARWDTRTFDLDQLEALDLFVSNWGPKLYVHTILSWAFADGQHLAVSIETRKRRGQRYSAVRGFFRQFELIYVAADERDLVGLRIGPRHERVQLFRLQTTPTERRNLLLAFLESMNDLARRPRWYHAITSNCTTEVFRHVYRLAPDMALDFRILANGRMPEMLHDLGRLDTALPLSELEMRSVISPEAAAHRDDPDFSRRIRRGLPGFPADDGSRPGDVSLN